MDLNQTPSANRTHIAFFGVCNAGKSSVMNAITNQEISLVSKIKGTTTDPVKKAMEILPLGAVTLIDTAGLDDIGKLGTMRVAKTMQILRQTDIAIIVVDATGALTQFEQDILTHIKKAKIPYILAYNKADLLPAGYSKSPEENSIYISAKTGQGIDKLKEKIAHLNTHKEKKYILKDLVQSGDSVILVIPIDESAPKGRLILPQQQVIRELLDLKATAIISQVETLADTLNNLKAKPKLIITDSQAFNAVNKIVPADINLTSFSILFARYKGNLALQLQAVKTLDTITNDDTILISEGCTHHRQCNDIGTVKLPNWVRNYTAKNPKFIFTSGTQFPQDLSPYKLVIHCGACMINEQEMKARLQIATAQKVPMTNYGMVIAHTNGILKRTLAVFQNKK